MRLPPQKKFLKFIITRTELEWTPRKTVTVKTEPKYWIRYRYVKHIYIKVPSTGVTLINSEEFLFVGNCFHFMCVRYFEYMTTRALPAWFNMNEVWMSQLRHETNALKIKFWKIDNGATLITLWGNFDHRSFQSLEEMRMTQMPVGACNFCISFLLRHPTPCLLLFKVLPLLLHHYTRESVIYHQQGLLWSLGQLWSICFFLYLSHIIHLNAFQRLVLKIRRKWNGTSIKFSKS